MFKQTLDNHLSSVELSCWHPEEAWEARRGRSRFNTASLSGTSWWDRKPVHSVCKNRSPWKLVDPTKPVSSWTSNMTKTSPLSNLSGQTCTRAAGTRRGAKPREVQGFVGAISSVIATDSCLHAAGITYYPDRSWAVAIPAYLMGALVLLCLGYTGLCYMATPPPDALSTLVDVHTRQPLQASGPVLGIQEEEPIHPISDMPITDVNRRLFLHNN